MRAYTIHEPPEPPADRMDRADSLRFVKEGMSWIALFFAPIWLASKGLWWALAGFIASVALWCAIGTALGLGEEAIGWGVFALQAIVAFEADSIERYSLQSAGWREIGAVTGRTQDECERNFFDNWLPDQPVITPRVDGAPNLGGQVRS